MSSNANKPKPGSRWGSLLSGAVLNLESRLDTFFEEDGNPAKPAPRPRADGQASPVVRPTTPLDDERSQTSFLSRNTSTRQDRITRLAVPETTTSSVRASSESRTTGTTGTASDLTSRTSFESSTTEPTSVGDASAQKDVASQEVRQSLDHAGDNMKEAEGDTAAQFQSPNTSNRPSLDAEGGSALVQDDINGAASPVPSAEELQARIAQMQADQEGEALQRQEEVQSYLERIDALQAKLEYLAKEASESAREKASDAPADSLQKKLAAKDEQIALLMEEGQKLSKAEVTYSGTARKLRSKIADDGRELAEMKRKVATSEKSSAELMDRVRKIESRTTEVSGRAARVPRLEKELQNVKAVRDEKEATIHYLRDQLDIETKKAEDATTKANEAALEQQQQANQSLQDDMANAKIERQLSEERLRAEIRIAKEEVQREQESKRAAEAQMRNEITVLESRVEAMRVRTEEASAGSGNDSQAKLMRQIETLQTQYSLASDNWQGIESSMQARLTALEKERDDTSRAESEARKKIRDSNNNARRLQEQTDELAQKASIFEQELSERQAHANKVEERARDFENSLKDAKASFERERQQWQTTLAGRIEEEKVKWRQEASTFPGQDSSIPSMVESPSGSMRKPQGLDLQGLGFGRKSMPSRQFSSELSIPSGADRSANRRSFTKPSPRGFEVTSPSHESGRSTPWLNCGANDAPSIHTQETDDMFDNDSSPHRTVNDMISVSTANAGPSVQLVERMSAAVRRLESEKAANKDELSRLATQRDEARKEVVALMSEVEEKRALDTKVNKLQESMAEVEQRYQTTLEMYGEKTERVDELEADVADLKKIYRELVQTMG